LFPHFYSPLSLSPFFFYLPRAPCDLHSFPTRRSSDLRTSRFITRSCGRTFRVWMSTKPSGWRITALCCAWWTRSSGRHSPWWARSEEHTSELQSLRHLVCRLLLEKKKKNKKKVEE